MTKLTKAQLLARIDEVQAECAQHIRVQEAMQQELNALYAAQRPSRCTGLVQANSVPARIVRMNGCDYYKVASLEGGRRVFTYKPVAAH